MSTPTRHIHPLISRLRDEIKADDFLTYEEAASQIGVSLRTLSSWMNTDTVPQKRYRRQLAAWLDGRTIDAEAAAA